QVKGGIECEKLAQRFFSPQEVQDLLATPQADRAKAFVRIWTLKEAYVKARGEGLSIPLNRFAFSLRVPHTIGFAADAALDASPIEWRVCHADLPDHHLLALCAGRSALQTEARILRCVSVTSVPPPEGVLHVQDMVTLPLPQVTVPGHVT
ncbi:MAG: 4-phosphopantetheinyl transferase family protein, partial [Proteobacteria bacterium]|nr:4-phosphopantetheinyl transferase family protein [Pseudomonadota bacterium]